MKTISRIIYASLYAISAKATDFNQTESGFYLREKIVLPGERVSLRHSTLDYSDIVSIFKRLGIPNAKKQKVTIQDENNIIDLSFLDDISILVSERSTDGAPPNADGIF